MCASYGRGGGGGGGGIITDDVHVSPAPQQTLQWRTRCTPSPPWKFSDERQEYYRPEQTTAETK